MRDLIKGNTPEERQKSTEVLLKQMQRRMHKTVYVLSPPVCSSGFKSVVELGETFLQFLFPYKGEVKSCLLYLDDAKIDFIEVDITIKRASSYYSRVERVKPARLCKVAINEAITEGDIISFTLITAQSADRNVIPQNVTRLSGSFLSEVSAEYMKSSHKQVDDLISEE